MSLPHFLRLNASDHHAINMGYYYDESYPLRVKAFFEKFLSHSKGAFAGQKFNLLPWQWERVIAPLFGWRAPNGSRRFRRCGIGVPKKNGKSTLLAGLSIYMLCADGESGAEVYSAAADRDQASIIFNEAANMVESSRALSSILLVRRSRKTIECPVNKGIYRALSADVPTKEGLNISCLLFDELHAQKTRALWDTLKYAGAARKEPLSIWISTAGVYDQTALWWSEWQRALEIQESKSIDVTYLPVIYCASEFDEINSEETWKKANPSYGITITEQEMRIAAQEAMTAASEENIFRRYRLNIPVKQESKWIQHSAWERCADKYEIPRGAKCWLGLDLGSVSDITAAVLIFRASSGIRRLLFRFWLPEKALRRRRDQNLTALDAWVGKYITVTPGETTDYGHIREEINKLAGFYRINGIAYDPWNATQLSNDLEKDGHKMYAVRQTYYSLGAATKELERLILRREVLHDGNPVMAWMMNNVVIEQDAAGNIKPSKRRASEKIDGVSALITGLAADIEYGEIKKSVYDRRGMQII